MGRGLTLVSPVFTFSMCMQLAYWDDGPGDGANLVLSGLLRRPRLGLQNMSTTIHG